MKRSPRPRRTAELSKSLQQQLNMYALAAGAAGVGALALAQPSEAKIVYTPAHVNVASCHAYGIDLDHNGTADIYLNWCGGEGRSYLVASADPNLGNGVAVSHSPHQFALAIFRGAKIGPARRFFGRTYAPAMAAASFSTTDPDWYGLWANGGKGLKNRYLGAKFKSNGQFHYGWARVSVSISTYIREVLLTGYAYETIPGKAIVAGKTKGYDVTTVSPASLGHLAAGASAIPAWRVKQTAATTH